MARCQDGGVMAGMGAEAIENWGPSRQRPHRPLSSTQDGSALWSVTWMQVQGGLWVSGVRGLPDGQWASQTGRDYVVVLTQSLGMGWGACRGRHQAVALCQNRWGPS